MNNEISGYKLILNEQKFNQPDINVNVPSNSSSRMFSGLEEFDNYEVRIRSVSIFSFESSLITISITTMEAGMYHYW